MNLLHGSLAKQLNQIAELAPERTVELLGHSIALGAVLMAVTLYSGVKISLSPATPPAPGTPPAKAPPTPESIVLASSNALYLCIGMAAVMLLVNNNLARALAIGAAIALVRFRVKVDGKSGGMCLFYSVLAGMACGVDQVPVAYGVTLLFAVIQLVVLIVALSLKSWNRGRQAPAPTPPLAAPMSDATAIAVQSLT